MSKRKKFYVVWKGLMPGVYETWEECQRQVAGFPGAQFKSFNSREAAQQAFTRHYEDYRGQDTSQLSPAEWEQRGVSMDSICVDAACSGNPGVLEYQGIDTASGRQVFYEGPLPEGTNNIGEFLAIVHALDLLKQTGRNCPVYSDSEIAIGWVHARAIRTTLPRRPANAKLFTLVDRALKWLAENRYRNEITKWRTEDWGEIPADFGRK